MWVILLPHRLLYWAESVGPVPNLHKFQKEGCTHDHWGAAENCDDFSACAYTRMNVCVRVCTRQRRCLSHFPTPCRLALGPADHGSPVRSHPAAVRGPNYRPGIIQSRPLASCQGLPLTPQCCFRVVSGDPNSTACALHAEASLRPLGDVARRCSCPHQDCSVCNWTP